MGKIKLSNLMKLIIVVLVWLFLADEIDDLNNDPNATWKAKRYPPEVITLESMRQKLIHPWSENHKKPSLGYHVGDLPTSFDSRTQWGDLILPVRDQQQCGSCWAFAVAEATGDRIGITQGKSNGVYSPQDLVSCDTRDSGCHGGSPSASWSYVQKSGLALEDCLPYTSGPGETGQCPTTCANGSAIDRSTKATKVYAIDASQMQNELITYGPFELAFTVYADFMSYSSGVYQHTWGGVEGGHAVLLVGWGVQGHTPYWIVQNSWNIEWGLDGYFWILRGVDECGIEGDAYAGQFGSS